MSEAPPHILVSNVFFAPWRYGGATIVAGEVAKSLVRRGLARVSAFSVMSRADLMPYTIIRTQCDGIDNYVVNLPSGRAAEAYYDNPEVSSVFARLIETLKPDVAQLHCVQELGAGLIETAKVAGLPTIVSTHDFWWLCERQFMIRPDQSYCGQDPIKPEVCARCVADPVANARRQERLSKAIAGADLVTFPSGFARDLHVRSGVLSDCRRAQVWENGVTLPGTAFFEKQAARRARDGRVTFGFVGGPSHMKGWPLVQKAFSSLETDALRGLLVDGAVDGTWWTDHFRRQVTQMRGEWEIVPRFEQDTIDDFYAEIDVLLFMSQWKETFGLTVREAIARGIRVIQTDSGGTTEHAAVERDRLIPIGASPEVLKAEIKRCLASGASHPAPTAVASYEDQADQLMRYVAEL